MSDINYYSINDFYPDSISIGGLESIHFEFSYNSVSKKIEATAKCKTRKWYLQGKRYDSNSDIWCDTKDVVFTGKLILTDDFRINDVSTTFNANVLADRWKNGDGYYGYKYDDKEGTCTLVFTFNKNVLSYTNCTVSAQTDNWPYGDTDTYNAYDQNTDTATFA